MAYDIGVIDLAPPGRFERVDPSLEPFDGKQGVVAGLAKLAQSVIFLFSTEKGSFAYDVDIGASPVKELTRSRNLLKDTIDTALSKTTQEIQEQLLYLGIGQDDSERLAGDGLKIWAEDLDELAGSIIVSIEITSAAGDQAVYESKLSL